MVRRKKQISDEEKARRKKKATCPKCNRYMQYSHFYTGKDGDIYPICKTCLTAGIDVTKRSTFDHILKEFDVPFIKNLWLTLCKRTYMKGRGMSPQAVLGGYLRTCKLHTYYNFRYADSEQASFEYDRRNGFVETDPKGNAKDDENAPQDNDNMDEEHLDYVNFEFLKLDDTGAPVSWASKQELIRRQKAKEEKERQKEIDKMAVEAASRQIFGTPTPPTSNVVPAPENAAEAPPVPSVSDRAAQKAVSNASINLSNFQSMLEQEKTMQYEKSITDELSADDIKLLSLKWGENYRPSEWLRLEEMYQKYCNEFEMNVDREEVLKKMCKTSLKMDQALDEEDIQTYVKLQTAFDSLRKSGKFTEAQNKDKQEKYLDSVGELVAAVEKQGGIIPQFDYQFEVAQDKVDFTLKDMQSYTYNLVRNEMGLGNLIETYIEKLDQQKSPVSSNSLADGLVTSREEEELQNDLAAERYYSGLEQKTEEEANMLLAQFEDLE